MSKVYINSSTKLDGKLVPPGEYEVSAEKKKELGSKGLIGKAKKSNRPTNEKEIIELVAKVEKLESELKDSESGDTSKLKDEIKTLKSENDNLKKEIKALAGDKEEHKGLLAKFGLK